MSDKLVTIAIPIYNAMPYEAVEGLVEFMDAFSKKHPKKEGDR